MGQGIWITSCDRYRKRKGATVPSGRALFIADVCLHLWRWKGSKMDHRQRMGGFYSYLTPPKLGAGLGRCFVCILIKILLGTPRGCPTPRPRMHANLRLIFFTFQSPARAIHHEPELNEMAYIPERPGYMEPMQEPALAAPRCPPTTKSLTRWWGGRTRSACHFME